jgi:hypothetical protein
MGHYKNATTFSCQYEDAHYHASFSRKKLIDDAVFCQWVIHFYYKLIISETAGKIYLDFS